MRMLEPREVKLLVALLGLVMGILVTSSSVSAGVIGVTVLSPFHPRMKIAQIAGLASASIAGKDLASWASDGVVRIALAFNPTTAAIKLSA
jgi:hypothetical protein